VSTPARAQAVYAAPKINVNCFLKIVNNLCILARMSTVSNVVPHPTIALLRANSLATAAQQEIERMILEGEIAPGAKLAEAWLSERLGVSRGPIREAFRMLEEVGLVRQEKNRGVFVRDIPHEEAAEIYDLRAAMDELVGRRLAVAITPTQMKALRGIADRMEQAVKADDRDGYHMLNLQFHDRLVEFAGNRKMAAIYGKLVKELVEEARRAGYGLMRLETATFMGHAHAVYAAITISMERALGT
jgi:DNA-binding GntR family transcriptional regulator